MVDKSLNDIGLVNLINILINKKYDSISDLNSLKLSLQDGGYDDLIEVVATIVEDENNHIGKLQHIASLISPDAANISNGEEEAIMLIGEGLRNSKNFNRHRRALTEEADDEIVENPISYYLSHYKESAVTEDDGTLTPISELIDYEEFEDMDDAKEELQARAVDLMDDGFELKSSILLVKPSKYIGGDEYFLIEDELGSEQYSLDQLQQEEE